MFEVAILSATDAGGYRVVLLGLLPGRTSDDVGKIAELGTFSAKSVLVLTNGDNTVRLAAHLPQNFEVPGWAIRRDDDTHGAISAVWIKQVIEAQQAAEQDRLKARLCDAIRRFETIEIEWGAKTDGTPGTFLGLPLKQRNPDGTLVDLRGEAKLSLFTGLFSGDNNAWTPSAEFHLRLAVRFEDQIASGGPILKLDRTYALCAIINAQPPILRIDLDDFNFSLAEIELTKLDLASGVDLQLPNAFKSGARLFDRLLAGAGQMKVKVEPTSGDAVFCVRPARDELQWALASRKLEDADWVLSWAEFRKLLAQFEVEIRRPTDPDDGVAPITITELTLAHRGAEAVINGRVTATGGEIQLPDGHTRIGPLEILWSGAKLVPSAKLGVGANADFPLLLGALSWNRLVIRLIDDPDTVLALKGEVELTPSGSRIVSLELIEPYPIKLVEQAGAALIRGVQQIVQFVGQLKSPDLERLRRILEIIGRFAGAVARSAVIVAEKVGQAIVVAARAIVEVLVSVAEAAYRLLQRLASLLDGAGTPALDIEVRLSLHPIEIRQMLISVRGAQLEAWRSHVLGLDLEVPGAWRPALLIDLVAQPGAYLVVSQQDPSKPDLVTLSTDLWLEHQGSVQSMRDASAVSGDRPDAPAQGSTTPPEKPLVSLDVKWASADSKLVVLAGVSRGKGLFFQKIVSPVDKSIVIPGTTTSLTTINGPFVFEPLANSDIAVGVDFQKDRLLPLLGMGEPGNEKEATEGDTFIDRLKKKLGQVVSVKEVKPGEFANGSIPIGLMVDIQVAGVRADVTLSLVISLKSLQASLTGGANELKVMSKRIEDRALGLTWIIEQKKAEDRKANKEIPMFGLTFNSGETAFALLTDEAQMFIRFDEITSEGEGLTLGVDTFRIGRNGLDLAATKPTDKAVRMNGLNVPFKFTHGSFRIASSRLVEAVVGGRGSLPPALIGEADCSIALTFRQDAGGIVLQAGKVEIDKKGEPIVCHTTRFTLTITDLDIGFEKDGGYHFFFIVTGSLRFTPKGNEFSKGLLSKLKDVEMQLDRAPLTGDARVLARHISFKKALNPKKRLKLYNLFELELRAIAYFPASREFKGEPAAICLSGQIKFADIGDLMKPKIDVHDLLIAPPAENDSQPRIKAAGLGIDLELGGGVKVRGSMLAVDPETRSLEGRELAPPGYETYGFLGEGAVDIPGWGSMQAALGFVEVEIPQRPGERRKAFFLYLQKDGMAIEIPTPFWTFYMREVGFGFGFRYTLAGIKDAESAKSPAQLIRILDDVSKRQGDLARFTAWKPDVEKDNFTLAMRAAFQMYPAEQAYSEENEATAENPLFFDIVAALRSDFTFLMSARAWLGVNYTDFRKNTDNLREKPGLRGYLYISAPRSELLARTIADSKGFIGERLAGFQKGQVLRKAVESVDWTSTLYIRPGLFHQEFGWPDQLVVRLIDEKNMKVTVRGGMIFRAAEDGLLWGYNIGADALIKFEGKVGRRIGVGAFAELTARFEARVLAFIAWKVKGSLFYGLISLDATLRFEIRAWCEIDLKCRTITLKCSFSFSVQFSAAVEIGLSTEGVGGRVAARIAVRAFGCTLAVAVGCMFNENQLKAARARVQRFMAMSITVEQADAPSELAAKSGDRRVKDAALNSEAEYKGDADIAQATAEKPKEGEPLPPITRCEFGREIRCTDFWLVLIDDPNPDNADYAYALLVPKDARDVQRAGFYSSAFDHPETTATWERSETEATHKLKGVGKTRVKRWTWETKSFLGLPDQAEIPVPVRWNAPMPLEEPAEASFSLAEMFDECFICDTRWKDFADGAHRIALNHFEPKGLRFYSGRPDVSTGTRESRDAERDAAQRGQARDAAEFPFEENAYQARSSVMTLFLEQFVDFVARGGAPPQEKTAHVLDLGLVFHGPVEDLEKLRTAKVHKSDQKPDDKTGGSIEVLNPRNVWFDIQDPVFTECRSERAMDGIKLGWRLELPHAKPAFANEDFDPEHFVRYYEVQRLLEGVSKEGVRVKPAPTIGEQDRDKEVGRVNLLAADWDYTDDLADLTADQRRGLLKTGSEGESLEAAKAWLKAFPNKPSVKLRYTITPVDIAGTRGLPKSFVVEIHRPKAKLRPAIGELRIVQTLGSESSDVQPEWQDRPGRPDDLDIYLSFTDSAWPDGKIQHISVDGADYEVDRRYVLHVDPDDIEPAGYFGSDGVTSRIRGPHPSVWPYAKDAIATASFSCEAEFIKPDDPSGIDMEEAQQTGRAPRRWIRLIKSAVSPRNGPKPLLVGKARDAFLNALWRRGESGPRVAVRFALETWIRITPAKSPGASSPVVDTPKDLTPYEYASRRVPVPVEFIVQRWVLKPPSLKRALDTFSTLRPEAFEWPVHLVFPPLIHGQVSADAGIAQFLAPAPEARLADLLATSSPAKALRWLPDAERRVLTEIGFDALPAWADGALSAAAGAREHPLHRSTIAAFDVHEVDLDDLAKLDTVGADLLNDAATWRRARRVAQVELLTPQLAQLVPHVNSNWQGWHAHYPSETQRHKIIEDKEGASQRIQSPWFSARESTCQWPMRRPRMRLFPDLSESTISELLQSGRPDEIEAQIVALADTKAYDLLKEIGGIPPLPSLVKLTVSGVKLSDSFKPPVEGAPLVKQNSSSFEPSDVRNLLLCLGFPSLEKAKEEKLFDEWRKDPSRLDGLVLRLTGKRRLKTEPDAPRAMTGTIEIPLELRSPLHPVLEEILSETALHANAEGMVYRRYVVMVQPPPPFDAADANGFFSATGPGTDPYGWQALQSLGLSVTVRAFDPALGEFEGAEKLLKVLDDVMNAVLSRWNSNPAGELNKVLCQPFVEVHLRPSVDRSMGSFDAVRGMRQQSVGILEDRMLSMVQLSLRPAPVAAWSYYRTQISWTRSPESLSALIPTGKVRSCAIVLQHCGVAFDVLDPGSGVVQRITDQAKEAAIPIRFIPRQIDAAKGSELALELLFRVQAGEPAPDRASFLLRLEEGPLGSGATGITLKWNLVEEHRLMKAHGPHEVPQPGIPVATLSDPFEGFDELSADDWAAAFGAIDLKSPFKKNDRARDALACLLPSIKARSSQFEGWLDKDLPALTSAYVVWSQRFLDYCTPPPNVDYSSPSIALAAPNSVTPWRLAWDDRERVTLSFVHSDRWAHARGYAIKPSSRYKNIFAAAGVLSHESAEQLVPPGSPDVSSVPFGFAIARTRRTERVEPPVVLGSRSRGLQGGRGIRYELILARHNEEALAHSNRALYARLEQPTTKITFLRSYRMPRWPGRLNSVMDASLPPAVIYPERDAELPAVKQYNGTDALSSETLREIVEMQPNLWKGADVWEVAPIPPHYKLITMATATAGIVVSGTSLDVHDDVPRQSLVGRGDELFGGGFPASVSLDRLGPLSGAVTSIRLRHRLVSHRDLTPSEARAWLGDAATGDVCWWPDPDVTYLIYRKFVAEKSTTSEEDLEIRLVADGLETDGQDSKPIVLRARGTRFEPTIQEDPYTVSAFVQGAERTFVLETRLARRHAEKELRTESTRLSPAEAGTPEQQIEFNGLATAFAVIVTAHRLVLDLPKQSDDEAIVAYIERLKGYPSSLRKLVDSLPAIGRRYESATPLVASILQFARTIEEFVSQQLPQPNPTVDEVRARLRMPFRMEPVQWAPGWPDPKPPDETCGTVLVEPLADMDLSTLIVYEVPADEEVKQIQGSDSPPAVKKGGRLWPIAARGLTGGANELRLRAIDGRNRNTEFVEYAIAWPAWVRNALDSSHGH